MIEVTKLKNGLRVATDTMTDVESVTVAVCVGVGSRHEDAKNSGISHFLEHMAFKGTKARSAKQIAEEVDDVGGYMNAYTSKDRTVYYVKVLKDNIDTAVDILFDILQNSVFSQEEIEKERGVILQEMAAGNDTPDDIVFDYFYETIYSDQSLGRPIIGSKDTVNSFGSKDFEFYIKDKYNTGNMVVSMAGNVSHKQAVSLVEKFLQKLEPQKAESVEGTKFIGGDLHKVKKDLEQTQFLLGFTGCSYFSDNFYRIHVLSNIIGGSMSSRLFQEVREKMGLVYTISTFLDSYSDTGVFGVYAGTSPESLKKLTRTVLMELNKAVGDIQEKELLRTVNQFKSGLMMAKESTSSRAQKLGRDLLVHGRYIDASEVMEEVSSITIKDLQSQMQEILSSEKCFVTYGGNEHDVSLDSL